MNENKNNGIEVGKFYMYESDESDHERNKSFVLRIDKIDTSNSTITYFYTVIMSNSEFHWNNVGSKSRFQENSIFCNKLKEIGNED